MTRRAVPRFLDWLRDGGAQLSKLSVQETASGRGVVATASYSAGEVLLRVPDRLLLTVKAAEARPAVAATLQRARAAGVHRNSGTMALACALTDASPECFYQPYRDVLPTSVDHLPLFWSAEDISLLAGTPLADEIEDRRGAIEADCDALGLMDPEPRRAFQVAEALVLSRAFDFDEGRKRAMVPFADLLNSNRHTRRHVDFSYEDDAYVMRAVRDGAAGEEVTDS
mmetsp:Transcript_34298/g.103363  ORF Transcript_34298/g.103363 Transcript_34298/m.103363 type:complete len:226 (+) Transcript_34298:519-1196(+)